jgi:ComF family protein
MNAFSLAASFARELVIPSPCARCGGALSRAADAYYGLCTPCRETLRAAISVPGGDRCDRCGRPLFSEMKTCMACRRADTAAYDRALLLFPYRGAYQEILRAWKFGSHPWLGRFLAECLITAQTALKGEGMKQAVWVPVPPRPGKIRKTGRDQVESLARLLERSAKPVCRCLKRLPSETQKKLGREQRLLNLTSKIRVAKRYKGCVPETAILFDDVYTTGNTLNVCAKTLKEHGAQHVYGFCLFYD